jgi:hypothetical protein
VSESQLVEVCQPERTVALDVAGCCSPLERAQGNPIDTYVDHQRHVLLLGDPNALTASPTLARLLLLGLVTGVESYFRTVLASTLKVCPLSRAAASEQVIPFGSVNYYGASEIELALFEGSSFSSAKEIRNRTQKVSGIQVPNSGSLNDALEKFQLVCELRHAAVHAHGSLTSGNAQALGLPPALTPGVVQLDLAALHSLGSVCLSVVRAFNRFFFEAVVRRWIAASVLVGDWNSDWRRFRSLHAVFYSLEDGVGETDPRKAYLPIRSRLLKRTG